MKTENEDSDSSIDVIAVFFVQREVLFNFRTHNENAIRRYRNDIRLLCLVGKKFAREIRNFDVDTARGWRRLQRRMKR
jgi:hypothetical protein